MRPSVRLPDLKATPPPGAAPPSGRPPAITAPHSHVSAWPASVPPRMAAPSSARLRPKLCLVMKMEAFLRRELGLVTSDGTDPMVTLPVYRECFKIFVSHFKEYSGILSTILREYDAAIEHFKKRLKQDEQQQSHALAMSQQTSTIMESEFYTIQQELASLRSQVRQNDRTSAEMAQERDRLLAEVQEAHKERNRRDAELADEKHRNASFATALRDQAERQHRMFNEMKKLKSDNRQLGGKADELSHRLQDFHRERQETQQQANKDEIYCLEQSLMDSKEEVDELKLRTKKLLGKNFELNNEVKQLKLKFDRYVAGVKTDYGRSMTPRPGWTDTFNGEEVDWPDSEARPTSQEFLDAVRRAWDARTARIKELEDKAKRADVIQRFMEDEALTEVSSLPKNTRFFIGYGTSENVPKYLRWHGKVKFTNMSKGECERQVKMIWNEKLAPQKLGMENFRDMPMDEFFYYILMKTCNQEEERMIEMAYNLIDSLERYKYDADLEMFRKILNGQVPEAVHADQMKMMHSLKAMFAQLDEDNTGKVRRKECKDSLLKLFPAKPHEDLLKVRYHLMMDAQGPWIHYKDLFNEDSDGNEQEFIECLRDQHLHEIQEYTVDVEQLLRNAADETGMISLLTVKQVIQDDDVEKSEIEINEYIARGIGVHRVSQISWNEEVPVDPLVENMKTGLMKRTSKKPQKNYIRPTDEVKKPPHEETTTPSPALISPLVMGDCPI